MELPIVMNIAVPDTVNNAAEEDISKGKAEAEEQPDLYHLDVGGDRETLYHRDVHACQDQHYR